MDGGRCARCGYVVTPIVPACPTCGGAVAATSFADTGTVWSSIVVHVRVGERRPPYGLAYVDLDDGPRLLVDQVEARDLPVGSRVHLDIEDGARPIAREIAL